MIGGGSGESLPACRGFEGAKPLASPNVLTLGRLAPLYYALRRRPPLSPPRTARRTAAEHLSHYRNRAGDPLPPSSGERDPMAGPDPGRRGPLATSSSPPRLWKQQRWYRVGIGGVKALVRDK